MHKLNITGTKVRIQRLFSALFTIGVLTLLCTTGIQAKSKSTVTGKNQLFNGIYKTLKNGLQVVIIKNTKAPIAHVQVYYKVGGRHDPKGKMGLSHFLEHMMFRGKTKLYGFDQFYREITPMGARNNCNAYTSFNCTCYHQSVPLSSLRQMLMIEAARMHKITLSEKIVKKEREVVQKERNMSITSNPGGAFNEVVFGSMMLNDALQYSRNLGYAHEIATLNKDDLITHHRNFYGPNNAILVVTSPQDVEKTLKVVTDCFCDIKLRPLPKGLHVLVEPKHMPAKLHLDAFHPQVVDSEVNIIFKLPGRKFNFKELLVLKFAVSLLNDSRGFLYQQIIKQDSLATDVGAWHYGPPMGCLVFGIYAQLKSGKKLTDLHKKLQEFLESIKKSPLSQQQFDIFKSSYIRALKKSSDDFAKTGDIIGDYLILGFSIEQVNNLYKTIEGITLDDLNNILLELVSSPYKMVATIHPEDENK